MTGLAAPISDEILFDAYRSGDQAAFRLLFTRYSPLLTRVMQRGLHRQSEVNDLVQQVFLQVHRARNDFDSSRRFRPWLLTIAMNMKRQYLRKASRRREELTDDAVVSTEGHDPVAADQRRLLREALATLPAAQREVIELHWLEGLPFAEVADVVGASVSAVKVRAHRGYHRLREAVERLERNRPGSSGIAGNGGSQ